MCLKLFHAALRVYLIGYELLPFTKTRKRKAVTRSKFYFFDVGVVNSLKGIESITPGNADFGDLFEHFIINEVRAYNSYSRKDSSLLYWRTKDTEVDLIIGKTTALEIKSTERVQNSHFKGLQALREEEIVANYLLVSRSKIEGIHDGIRYVYYETFLKMLWNHQVY